jgi:hypothetical protein
MGGQSEGVTGMTHRTMTLAMPEATYAALRRRAEQARHSVEDEAIRAMEAALAEPTGLPTDVSLLLASLELLDTDQLLAIVRRAPVVEDAAVLAALNEKRQTTRLTEAEEALVRDLVGRYDRAVLIRAKALALLHERGEDVHALIAGA